MTAVCRLSTRDGTSGTPNLCRSAISVPLASRVAAPSRHVLVRADYGSGHFALKSPVPRLVLRPCHVFGDKLGLPSASPQSGLRGPPYLYRR
jgi:hypothetical protein